MPVAISTDYLTLRIALRVDMRVTLVVVVPTVSENINWELCILYSSQAK
jgi:hypothetical protein